MNKPVLAAMLSISGTKLSDEEKKLFERFNPLGVTLFAKNVESKTQLKNLTKEIREVCDRNNILIAIDQEGGRVRRLKDPQYLPYASQETLGKIAAEKGMTAAMRAVLAHTSLTAKDLKDNFINLNFAPVLDLAYPNTNLVLKSRCFGSDAKLVAELGNLMVEEYVVNGICPCIKHLPGHGRAENDPHLELPVINASLKDLENDFYPFRCLNYAPAGMTGHLLLTAIDDQFPATFSTKVIQTVIRDIIGFKGLLLSDAIDMHALSGDIGSRARLALHAGCDAVCYCFGDYNELVQVTQNCTIMSDAALNRFEKIKDIIGHKTLETAAAEYQNLIGDIERYDDAYDATEVLNKMQQKGGN